MANKPINDTYCARIIGLIMEESQWSVRRLARELNVSHGIVHHWKIGTRRPYLYNAKKIARLARQFGLEVSSDDLNAA